MSSKTWRVIVALLGAAVAGAAAPPPEHPPFSPTKDAVIGYHLTPAAGEAITARVLFRAGGAALRLDLPDGSAMLVAPETKSLTLVVPQERTATELPWADGPQAVFLLDTRAKFARKGESSIAGHKCTLWEATTERSRNQLCITADGILLRNQFNDAQGRRNLIEAFAVLLQPLTPAEFVVPDGFERLYAVPRPGPVP